MGTHLPESCLAESEVSDRSAQLKSDPHPKNRVWGFSSSSGICTRRFPSQPLEPHRVTVTTTAGTASGLVDWLSNDPIGISGGLNQYVFCGNDPVNSVDPLGLCDKGAQEQKDRIITLAQEWNKTSPRWSWNNQCGEQSYSLMIYLYSKGPWNEWNIGPLYGYKGWKFTIFGSPYLCGYQQNALQAIPFDTNSPVTPFYLDPYHGPLNPDRDVKVGTIQEFRAEYPNE